jgi:hypothetical protein
VQPAASERGRVADTTLIVYVRAYCHLCDDMVAALEPLVAGRGVEIVQVDVDADPALEARYGDRVPVLLAAGDELCHYHLEPGTVAAYLAGIG